MRVLPLELLEAACVQKEREKKCGLDIFGHVTMKEQGYRPYLRSVVTVIE